MNRQKRLIKAAGLPGGPKSTTPARFFILLKNALDNSDDFYRAITMRKRGICCRPVSVRPSVTFVHCIQTAEVIAKLISQPDS